MTLEHAISLSIVSLSRHTIALALTKHSNVAVRVSMVVLESDPVFGSHTTTAYGLNEESDE